MTTLTIGKVAKAAGLGVETVHFYERQGLPCRNTRVPSGVSASGAEGPPRQGSLVEDKGRYAP